MIDGQNLKNYLTDKSVTTYHRNIHVLATELYKVHQGLVHELMNDIFKKRDATYNFRNIKYKICFLWLRKKLWEKIMAQKYGNFCQVTL